jgi:hypothetical protein
MEREKELVKLVNVLRQTARMCVQSEMTGHDGATAAFCAEKYNRVLARLKELDEGVGVVFEPLPADTTLAVTAIACRQLAAYYDDELGPATRFNRAYGVAFDPQTFRDFWRESGGEIQDLGEFIRESIAEWTRHRHAHHRERRERREERRERREERRDEQRRIILDAARERQERREERRREGDEREGRDECGDEPKTSD